MAELSTEQLDCILRCTIPCGQSALSVLGVYPADRVPLKVHGDGSLYSSADNQPLRADTHYCFILNTDPTGQPGEHWLAFFYDHNTHLLEYFDSFGLPPQVYTDVYAALDVCGLCTHCTPVNTAGMLQSIQSTVCGHYCVAYLYWRAKHLVRTAPTHFALAVAKQYHTAGQRDKYIVGMVQSLLNRSTCCRDVLERGTCSQSCKCCYSHFAH